MFEKCKLPKRRLCQYNRRILSALLCAVLLLALTACGKTPEQTQAQKAFEQYCSEAFTENLKADAMSAHYLVSDPSRYGVTFEEEDYTLGEFSWEEQETIAEGLEELKKFDRSLLTESQQLTYDTLLSYLEIKSAYLGTSDLINLFAPDAGVVFTLQTSFEEYTFQDETDVRRYLSLLKSVPAYMDSCLSMTKKQSEKGYFMSDRTADEAIEACMDHFEKDGALLVKIFEKKLDKLELSEPVRKELIDAHSDAIRNHYLPSFKKAADTLGTLKGSGKNEDGLCGFGEPGKRYYRALIMDYTSSTMTPEDVIEMLDRKISELMENASKIPGADFVHALEYQPDFTDVKAMVDYLIEHTGRDFPAPVTTSYELDDMSVPDEDTSFVAYYLKCRLDDVNHNSVKINRDMLDTNTLQLYTTLAHETFAGHLYQFTSFVKREDVPNIRKAIDFLGTAEGWAQYAGACSIDYLDVSANTKKALLLNEQLPYLLAARVDAGVNYEGWSYQDTCEYLSGYFDTENMEDENPVEVFYRDAIGKPAQIIPYAIGQIKMEELRAYAEKELGDRFDILAYHQWVNDIGITSFPVYEAELAKWIEKQK